MESITKTCLSLEHYVMKKVDKLISDEYWFQSTNYGRGHKSASSVASASGNIYLKPGMSHYIPYGYMIAE